MGTGRSEACPRVWLPTKSIQMSLECCRCINFCDWFFPIFFCHYRSLSVGENAYHFVFSFQFIPIQEIVFLFEIYTPAFPHPFYSLLSLCRRSRFEKSDPYFKHTPQFPYHFELNRGFPLNATAVPTAQQIRLLLVSCGVDFEDAFYEQGDGPEFSRAGRGSNCLPSLGEGFPLPFQKPHNLESK